MSRRVRGRASSIAIVATVYAAASLVGWFAYRVLPVDDPRLRLLCADLVATLAVFATSVVANNSSLYDPYWSVAPPLLAMQMIASGSPDVPRLRRVLVMGLILVWALRLTWNFVRGWPGLHHEDWRYVDIRTQTKRAFWPASLVALHAMPTLIVYAGCYCLWPVLATSAAAMGTWDVVATMVGVVAIGIETLADEQLRAFRLRSGSDGRAMTTGLWRTSRHPNYLGEIGFWWSLALFGFATTRSPWNFAGAVIITALFVFATIPLAEKRAMARRADYAARMQTTRMLLPWPPRGRAGRA